jgi:hypothetical protein
MLTVIKEEKSSGAGFEALTKTAVKNTVFWIVTNVPPKPGMQVRKPGCLLSNNLVAWTPRGGRGGSGFRKMLIFSSSSCSHFGA